VHSLPGFAQGWWSVQDAAAQRAAPLLALRDGMRVLDACAAPGGKTAHALELADVRMQALDVDAQRLQRIDHNLQRLGLASRIRSLLSVNESLPAAGQGALAIETLASRHDLAALLVPLACTQTSACALAERTISRMLGGSCQVPLAAFAQVGDQTLHLQARLGHPDGSLMLQAQQSGPVGQAQALGQAVAAQLQAQGAQALMDELLAADVESHVVPDVHPASPANPASPAEHAIGPGRVV